MLRAHFKAAGQRCDQTGFYNKLGVCEQTTGGCGAPRYADVGTRASYHLGARCSCTLKDAATVEGYCAMDPTSQSMPVCTTAKCGDGIREGLEECDDTSKCCDQSTCTLKLHAQCAPDGENECCNADTCAYKLPSVGCQNGKGFCSMGHDYRNDFELDVDRCPLLAGSTMGCIERCAWLGAAAAPQAMICAETPLHVLNGV
ncbi:hypothetical protein T492DRAFT_872435 [Pavlovales sp. CCMP2436]|nr:hypothetical protein T492DRAFT_872435 [Pavlovales sp. CCMP2436]